MLDFHGDCFLGNPEGCKMHLRQRRRAYWISFEFRKHILEGFAGVLDEQLFDGLIAGHRAMVLKRDKGGGPFQGQQIVETAQVLTELDKYRPIPFHCSEGTLCTSFMASLKVFLPTTLVISW